MEQKPQPTIEQFLKCCSKYRIKTVAIGMKHKLVKSTLNWPFSHHGSIFSNRCEWDGWPAIWKVADELGIGGGCGNHDQYCVRWDIEPQVWSKAKNGKWVRIAPKLTQNKGRR